MFYLFWVFGIAFAIMFTAVMVMGLDNNGSLD